LLGTDSFKKHFNTGAKKRVFNREILGIREKEENYLTINPESFRGKASAKTEGNERKGLCPQNTPMDADEAGFSRISANLRDLRASLDSVAADPGLCGGFLDLVRQCVEAFPKLRGGLGFYKAEGEACRRAWLARLALS
jgi:hypothetical protein